MTQDRETRHISRPRDPQPATPASDLHEGESTATTSQPPPEEAPAPYSWKTILLSVISAAFGVQSQKNRERDFAKGRLIHFVLAGLLFILTFVGMIYLAVWFALAAE